MARCDLRHGRRDANADELVVHMHVVTSGKLSARCNSFYATCFSHNLKKKALLGFSPFKAANNIGFRVLSMGMLLLVVNGRRCGATRAIRSRSTKVAPTRFYKRVVAGGTFCTHHTAVVPSSTKHRRRLLQIVFKRTRAVSVKKCYG